MYISSFKIISDYFYGVYCVGVFLFLTELSKVLSYRNCIRSLGLLLSTFCQGTDWIKDEGLGHIISRSVAGQNQWL